MNIKLSVMLHAPRASILNNILLYSRKMYEDIYSTHRTPLTVMTKIFFYLSTEVQTHHHYLRESKGKVAMASMYGPAPVNIY